MVLHDSLIPEEAEHQQLLRTVTSRLRRNIVAARLDDSHSQGAGWSVQDHLNSAAPQAELSVARS